MPAERSNQRTSSSPSPSGFATPSSSKAPNPPVSLPSRAHDVLKAAREPRGSGAARGVGPRERLRRGFSLFKDDSVQRGFGDEHGHVLKQGEEENGLRQDHPGGVAHRDTADLESADTWFEHGREEEVGSNDKDTKMDLGRKHWLGSLKGMYVASPFFFSSLAL